LMIRIASSLELRAITLSSIRHLRARIIIITDRLQPEYYTE
jgi:hypothetical protein